MGKLIFLVCTTAIVLAVGIGVAGPGTRFGFWDYGVGLSLIRQLALPVMIAAGLSALSLVGALIGARGMALYAALATVAAGAAAYAPIKMKQLVDANPFIHDITTDFEEPPQIVAAADLPRKNPADYVGAEFAPRSNITIADAQRAAFPDLETIKVAGSIDETAEVVMSVVNDMGMEILEEGPTDDGWRVEAASTSLWFGFVDDFVVRLKPAGAQTEIDVRSKSRVGLSDLGANATRVRDFLERMQSATG
ncbi:MAG: DUF1499 domain-containing protein [Pseudomonadota bacterium]